MKLKNITDGPRGVNTADGPVLVDPGQTVEVNMDFETEDEKADKKRSAAELKILEKSGWWEIDGEAPEGAEGDEEVDLDSMTKQELIDYAAENDIDLDGATLKDDILAKVKKAK